MKTYKKNIIILIISFLIFINILSINNVSANNNLDKINQNILIKKIIISKNKLKNSNYSNSYIKKIDTVLTKLKKEGNLEKIQKINKKITFFINKLSKQKNIKYRKYIPLLNYLKTELNYTIYKKLKVKQLIYEKIQLIKKRKEEIEKREKIKLKQKEIEKKKIILEKYKIEKERQEQIIKEKFKQEKIRLEKINNLNNQFYHNSSSTYSSNSNKSNSSNSNKANSYNTNNNIEENYINKDFSKNLSVKGKGKIYYIDSISGNDDNNGLSKDKAWKTIKKIQSYTFNIGDSLLFKRGGKFYGSISWLKNFHGEKENPATIGAYGNGDLPIITTIKEHKLEWENIGNNIWKAKSSPEHNPERLLVNNKEILRADDLNSINGTKYFWVYQNNNLYLYSKNNPENNIISFSIPPDTIYFHGNEKYINIQNLNVQGGYRTSIYLDTTSHINILNSIIGNYGHKAIALSSSNPKEINNITIKNNIIKANFKFKYNDSKSSLKGNMEGIVFYGNVNNITVENNYIKNFGHANINMHASITTKDSVHNIKIFNNYVTAPDLTYGGRMAIDGNSYNVETYNNYFINIPSPNQLNGHDNYFHHNVIDNIKNSQLKTRKIGNGIGLQSYAGPVYNNIYEYNTILNTENSCIQISGNLSKGDMYNNRINNNILYNCNIAIQINKLANSGKEYNNKIYDNIIYSTKLPKNNPNNLKIDTDNIEKGINNLYNNIENINNLNTLIENNNSEYNIVDNNIYYNPNLILKGINKYKSNDDSINKKYGITK